MSLRLMSQQWHFNNPAVHAVPGGPKKKAYLRCDTSMCFMNNGTELEEGPTDSSSSWSSWFFRVPKPGFQIFILFPNPVRIHNHLWACRGRLDYLCKRFRTERNMLVNSFIMLCVKKRSVWYVDRLVSVATSIMSKWIGALSQLSRADR